MAAFQRGVASRRSSLRRCPNASCWDQAKVPRPQEEKPAEEEGENKEEGAQQAAEEEGGREGEDVGEGGEEEEEEEIDPTEFERVPLTGREDTASQVALPLSSLFSSLPPMRGDGRDRAGRGKDEGDGS